MGEKITYEMLLDAAKAGGSSALSEVTRLEPAGGLHTLVAPAKYCKGKQATYVFETRYLAEDGNSGKPVKTVLIDSRTSEANRIEQAILKGIEEGQSTLSRMPKMIVKYKIADEFGEEGTIEETDLDLPHRAFDAHFRLGFADPECELSICEDPKYVKARNSTPAYARDLFDLSPITVLLGGWDSCRKKDQNQARFASCVTGEIVGVLSDQEANPDDLITHRSGARIDPVGSGFYFDKKEMDKFPDRIGWEPSKKPQENKKNSGSPYVLGAIPPSTDALDGVSVRGIVRSRVLSFATLRSLCFGYGAEGDQAIRALLAALAIDGIARADAELYLRANAHLVEAESPVVVLHQRYGKKVLLEPFDIATADALLDEAYQKAAELDVVDWQGQKFCVQGDPVVIKARNNAKTEE